MAKVQQTNSSGTFGILFAGIFDYGLLFISGVKGFSGSRRLLPELFSISMSKHCWKSYWDPFRQLQTLHPFPLRCIFEWRSRQGWKWGVARMRLPGRSQLSAADTWNHHQSGSAGNDSFNDFLRITSNKITTL